MSYSFFDPLLLSSYDGYDELSCQVSLDDPQSSTRTTPDDDLY